MTLTAGTLSQVSVGSTVDSLSATAASGGTGPYTQQWYRSTTTGFTPGAGNIIAGATALTLNDSGLTPGTQYYYKVIYTDTGASNATITSAQLAVTTAAPQLNINSYAETTLLGVVDLQFSYNTRTVQIDASQATPLSFGQAVKFTGNVTGGVPTVVAAAADSDSVAGFINFNIKNISFPALTLAEISMGGNVIYLYSTAAIAAGSRVTLDLTTVGGVGPYVNASGANIVGYAWDGASAAGQLIRVSLLSPSFLTA